MAGAFHGAFSLPTCNINFLNCKQQNLPWLDMIWVAKFAELTEWLSYWVRTLMGTQELYPIGITLAAGRNVQTAVLAGGGGLRREAAAPLNDCQ